MDELTLLGSEVEYNFDEPNKIHLEKFEYSQYKFHQLISFKTDEFTSLCPMTGQPDFASLDICYIADKFAIESKSLKLYIFRYRNHGAFHEDCINKITQDIIDVIDPKYIRVIGDFSKRGGISIKPISEYCRDGFKKPVDLINQYDNFNFKN
jgi:7-cyano-7-deazaguanine reductase